MPLVLVLVGYAALDVLSGGGQLRAHDDVVLAWEEAAFGMQPARDWWRGHTSPFWSTLLHGVYFFYYLILAVPAFFFLLRGDWPAFRRFTRNVVCTFCVCFLVFVLYPVAGPYYVFERPDRPHGGQPPGPHGLRGARIGELVRRGVPVVARGRGHRGRRGRLQGESHARAGSCWCRCC